MKVLFTTPILEHPAAGGPQLRIENTIKALSRVCELHVVSRQPQERIGGAEAEEFYRQLCREFHYTPPTAGSSSLTVLRKAQSFLKNVGDRGLHRDASFILTLVDRLSIDVVWFGYGNISVPLMQAIKRMRPDLKIVCDTDSVWSRFVLREIPFERDSARRAAIEREGLAKEAEERAFVALCEVTTAVSEIDADYYRSLAADPGRVQVLSNVVDVADYVDVPARPADLRNPCMYLAGTFGHYHSPMDTAARWVLEEVLPLVRKQIPDITFCIAGRGSDTSFAHIDSPGVLVKGKLPSVLPYLCHADVALVPLKFESGTRFKILEAGACGIPLVSTVLGAEGIPVMDGRDILLADEPEDFAAAIVRVIQDKDLGKRLADNCRGLVRDRFSVEALVLEARQILKMLA